MKILLDECVPSPLRHLLSPHECVSTHQMGWAGVTNGELLRLAEPQFDLFITADQNLRYQQKLVGRRIAILELSTNKFRRPQAAQHLFISTITSMRPGGFHILSIP